MNPFTLVATVSAAFCAAAVVLWVRSYRVAYTAKAWRHDGAVVWLAASRGRLLLMTNSFDGHRPAAGRLRFGWEASRPARGIEGPLSIYCRWDADESWGGIHYLALDNPQPGYVERNRLWFLPCWWAPLAASVLPIAWCVRRRTLLRGAGRFRGFECDRRVAPGRQPESGATPQKA